MGYLRIKRVESKVVPRTSSPCKAKPITDVLNSSSWSNKRCFILCGGPSLENFDFSIIQNENTIGINKSFLDYNTKIVYAMDQRFYDSVSLRSRCISEDKELHSSWVRYPGIKVFLRTSHKTKFDPSIYYVNGLERVQISLDVSQGIYGGKNSGFGGMMLAISLGCKEIYFLGLDLKVDEKRKRTHHHSGYSHQKIENVKKVLKDFKREFENIALAIQKLGISVINLNPDSATDCFIKKDIREIL